MDFLLFFFFWGGEVGAGERGEAVCVCVCGGGVLSNYL